jgi:hypothetical protein
VISRPKRIFGVIRRASSFLGRSVFQLPDGQLFPQSPSRHVKRLLCKAVL